MWLNFEEGPQGTALCVEGKSKPRGTAGQSWTEPSKLNSRVIPEFFSGWASVCNFFFLCSPVTQQRCEIQFKVLL